MNWLKGLAPYVPPRLDAGVLEDLTGFARLGNSLENKAFKDVPYVPPRLDAGVLEDSTGFARLGNSLENKAFKDTASRL